MPPDLLKCFRGALLLEPLLRNHRAPSDEMAILDIRRCGVCRQEQADVAPRRFAPRLRTRKGSEVLCTRVHEGRKAARARPRATGITNWRCIASHHVPSVMHRDDFTPVNGGSLMRNKFDEISMHMEEKMGHPFFCCDAVLDTQSRQIAIYSGYAKEMMPISWKLADKRTYVHWAEKKYDVLVFGMPQNFHYGDGMGTNPIMMMQALSAQVLRFKRVMSDNCVIICSSICNGYFHDERWPYLRELYDLFQHDHMNTLPDMNRLGEYFATNEEYIRKYRYTNAFHPFHGFSMMSCGHIAEMNTSAIYIVGAEEPGYARGMGLKTRATFEEALEDAKKKYVGQEPNILALPMTFKKAAVHLCMKDPAQDCMDEYGHRHPCCC